MKEIDGELTTLLALPPEEGGFANDPMLGLVDNLGLDGVALDALKVYVGILAATILFIATNAGVIGASRITYSMATYRQLPEVFRRLHPRFKTPWLSLVVFAGIAPILVILPGRRGLPRHDVLVRRDAVVHGRARVDRQAAREAAGAEELVFRAGRTSGSAGSTGRCSRSSAGSPPGSRWLVIVVQDAADALGGARLARRSASSVYVVYRRRVRARAAARRPCARPLASARRSRSSTGACSCPWSRASASDEAIDVACAARGRAAARSSR